MNKDMATKIMLSIRTRIRLTVEEYSNEKIQRIFQDQGIVQREEIYKREDVSSNFLDKVYIVKKLKGSYSVNINNILNIDEDMCLYRFSNPKNKIDLKKDITFELSKDGDISNVIKSLKISNII